MRGRRIALRVLYWLAVLVVSLVLVLALVMFFESLDDSRVGAGGVLVAPLLGL
jgi:hypothetical protein